MEKVFGIPVKIIEVSGLPFEYAYAENAAINGVRFQFGTCVQDIQRCHQVSGFEVITNQGTLYSNYVINAAGVYADEIHNMVSEKKLHITHAGIMNTTCPATV